MRNSVFRSVAIMRGVIVLACSCEDCAAAIPIALAPKTATPIATASMTNLLMLRSMIASIYRTIGALYRRLIFADMTYITGSRTFPEDWPRGARWNRHRHGAR